MISNAVKERLLQKNWAVKCTTEQELSLVLQACDDAGIKWLSGERATEWDFVGSYPLYIDFCNAIDGITGNLTGSYTGNCTDITDWFFNAIKNNDDNGKLTPQNAEQEHWVQILLAMMQGFYVDADYGAGWTKAIILLHGGNFKYRIKPEPMPTPLPMSRWMWRKINKKWRFIAMDKDGQVFLYMQRPHPKRGEYGGYWHKGSAYCVEFPFYINTDGINWETSLTARPEDV